MVEWLAQTKASKLGDIIQILQTADLFVNLKLNVDFFLLVALLLCQFSIISDIKKHRNALIMALIRLITQKFKQKVQNVS